ncbi:MAG: RecQ family ATP-dependent DNA helicase [Verrucomicrobiales bacterium]|nr:RecQ family ATP-dependent DNA helicase [Verrucomicrobiales bacterium]
MNQGSAGVLLKQMLGMAAEFRDGQWEAIDLVANQRQRLLVVQRTGWGKSVVYFLATKILRDSGAGPTLLVSPLLSLMRNQIAAAEKLGIRARTIHSENLEEWPAVQAALNKNQCDVLLVAPERLGNAEFLDKLLPLFQGSIGLFVVDEAHCISDWGHDFRPDYRRIVRVLRFLPAGVPILCTTATANDRVVNDVRGQISHLQISRGPLVRKSLKLYNIKLDDQAERLAWLAHFIPQLPGNGIIYTLTIQDARRVAEWLKQRGVEARCYHADLPAAERIAAEQLLLENKVKALVATVALGMGFDKPDLGFVVHFQRPGSVVAYYQQVGRAGRAVDTAFGILLSGREDDEIQDYFIRTAFPPVEVMQGALGALGKAEVLTLDEIGAQLNAGRNAIEKALKLLEVEGAVQRGKQGWFRTANPWQPDLARFAQVTQHRGAELAQIKSYVEHAGCLMEFLARALDDPAAAPCGKCMNCTGHTTRRAAPRESLAQAVSFLRGDSLVLEPRDRWPKAALTELQAAFPRAIDASDKGTLKTVIPEQFALQPGRVLCIYGDAGWGPEVARGKYESGHFSEALVEASAQLVGKTWNPEPPPAWVCAVPSLHRPELVKRFAERLAARLGLPFVPALRKVRDARPQKEMHNSVQQLRNLLGAFAVAGPLPNGPVLLVDDVTDSRWTLTVLAVLLRLHGSGPVHPFALAKASPRGS